MNAPPFAIVQFHLCGILVFFGAKWGQVGKRAKVELFSTCVTSLDLRGIAKPTQIILHDQIYLAITVSPVLPKIRKPRASST